MNPPLRTRTTRSAILALADIPDDLERTDARAPSDGGFEFSAVFEPLGRPESLGRIPSNIRSPHWSSRTLVILR